ncbi:MAG: hypothetical protein AAGJ50_08335 [Pseudomonadota bacterium]
MKIYKYDLTGRSLQVVEKDGLFESHPDSTGAKGKFKTFKEAAQTVGEYYLEDTVPDQKTHWRVTELPE